MIRETVGYVKYNIAKGMGDCTEIILQRADAILAELTERK